MTTTTIQQQGHFRRNWLFYTLLLIATALCAYLWFSKNRALMKQMEAFEEERSLIKEETKEVFRMNAEQHLGLMMKTFVWAVRSELNRGNQEQIDQYFKQLVRSEKIQEVTLVDEEGTIVVSSNKKHEGKALDAPYANDALEIETTTVLDETNVLAIASPVMGFDARLGTLIVICNNDAFDFDSLMDDMEAAYEDMEEEADKRDLEEEEEEEEKFDEE